MRVGVIQSCYAPWRGYFDFIATVDLFVLYDDVQYSKGSWRSRNRIKTAQGVRWLTVPVHVDLGMRIDEVRIAHETRAWQNEHREVLGRAFDGAPYAGDAIGLWEEAVGQRDALLTDLNRRLLLAACGYLNIRTPIVRSSEFTLSGAATQRLLALLREVGATTYVSGPSAKAYLETERFVDAGIRLEYKTYSYPEYPQQWGAFVDGLTILDLIANCGPDATHYMTSNLPNEVCVS